MVNIVWADNGTDFANLQKLSRTDYGRAEDCLGKWDMIRLYPEDTTNGVSNSEIIRAGKNAYMQKCLSVKSGGRKSRRTKRAKRTKKTRRRRR
jgi:hypothetical protein